MASNKITIIGAGSVGATVAYTLTLRGLAAEIVLIDVNENKALGEAMDIRQGTPLCAPISIYAGDYQAAAGSDIVVITSGIARKPGQTRLELCQTNVNIIKQIAPEITKYAPDAIYVLVSNPVDILTYVFSKISGVPESHVLGTGTLLDTARLRSRISEYMCVNQRNVHAYVLGEHGDSSFIPWSIAQISQIKIADYRKHLNFQDAAMPELDYQEIENYIRTSGGKIIQRKGATFYAIAISVAYVCEAILDTSNTVLALSTVMHGEYGIDDVALSVPCIIGPTGVRGKVLPPMTEEEVGKLQHSAKVLKDVIRQIEI